MDFNALQHKLFEMDPVDPREDIARMKAQAQGEIPANLEQSVDYLNESVEVPSGSLTMDKSYSVDDFAALAGVVTEGKQKNADQIRHSEPAPKKLPKGSTKNISRDRLVGDSVNNDKDNRIAALEARVEALEAMLIERELTKPEEKEKERIVKGMKKSKSDFKDRYGDDAEAVMYATATKNAKKNESADSIKDALYAALNKKMGL